VIAFPPGEETPGLRTAPARFGLEDDAEDSDAAATLDAARATAAAVSEDLGPSGPVAAVLSGAETAYEDRASQRDMASAVADLYQTGGVGLFEAGTGVGKSLAYLVPALRSGKKVVISTGTIALQEQLVRKDIPLVVNALGISARVELLKGAITTCAGRSTRR